ncbi:hypothetical protein DPMN_025995 [Dreissena polymorpha]|uniref:Uncharacterized protein n=1 Tax=Dreissena polymorpha TaxID=45954 RepID=A0A9D4LSE4_DREPO|nr:hypothetical protein DPMN_025995 [Dreissena polymorpha]
MVTKTVLLSKILLTREEDKNMNPSMSFTKEKIDNAKMRTFFSGKRGRHDCSDQHSSQNKRGCYVFVSLGDEDVDIVKATVE